MGAATVGVSGAADDDGSDGLLDAAPWKNWPAPLLAVGTTGESDAVTVEVGVIQVVVVSSMYSVTVTVSISVSITVTRSRLSWPW